MSWISRQAGFGWDKSFAYTSTHYPQNYGFIPLTLPGTTTIRWMSLFFAASQPLPMTLVQCYPIGVIKMIDNGKNDEKIVAIPFSDPTYGQSRSIEELPKHIFSEMEHFFSVYKQLENKQTAVNPVMGKRRGSQDHKRSHAALLPDFPKGKGRLP